MKWSNYAVKFKSIYNMKGRMTELLTLTAFIQSNQKIIISFDDIEIYKLNLKWFESTILVQYLLNIL